jgi:hypothetical protein
VRYTDIPDVEEGEYHYFRQADKHEAKMAAYRRFLEKHKVK